MNRSLLAISTLLLTIYPMSSFGASPGYFDRIDATLALPVGASADRWTAGRYLRLSARLSVYSLYCDLDHKMGYSQRYSKFHARMDQLNQLSTTALGGTVAAYNAFEDARNEESLAFAQFDDPDLVCMDSVDKYKKLLLASPTALEKDLRTAPLGSR